MRTAYLRLLFEGSYFNFSSDLFLVSSHSLDQELDFDNNGVSKHLGQIADSMYEWEGPVAEQLDLTPADTAAIKVKYPGELNLQT